MKRFLVVALVLVTNTVLAAGLGEDTKTACFKHDQKSRQVASDKSDKAEIKLEKKVKQEEKKQ